MSTKVEHARRLALELVALREQGHDHFGLMLELMIAIDEALPEMLAGSEEERLLALRWMARRDQSSARAAETLRRLYPAPEPSEAPGQSSS
jgi:hypothetical protein